jgi:probable phosphoglycerate mutase
MSTKEKFYFVRHGQTDANLGDLAAGAGWDIELNANGHSQAKALAESDSIQACVDVKTICVSPMTRARQTAEALSSVLKAPIVCVDELKEWHLGEWEKRAWSELPNLYHPDTNPPGGESQSEFGKRIAAGLATALSHPGPVLIVAHGGVWHGISRLLSLPASEIDNCALKSISRAHAADSWTLE